MLSAWTAGEFPPAMTYVYILESVHEPSRRYVGRTPDLKRRFADHNAGRSRHTSKHKPWNLIAYLAFANERTAVRFELYLKSGSGRAFLLRHFFEGHPL
jgi:predicted GIY-YIG superfamily endonuclease